MSNDETKLYDEDGAVAEAGACGIEASLDARGVGIRMAHATLSYVSLSFQVPAPADQRACASLDYRQATAPTSQACPPRCAAFRGLPEVPG
jgi:hypothetical protein